MQQHLTALQKSIQIQIDSIKTQLAEITKTEYAEKYSKH